MKFRLLLLIGFIALLSPASYAVLAVQSFDPDKHYRFANSSDFIGNAYDWSGVARSNTSGRWVTMISSTHFVTSTHTTDPFSASPLTVGENIVFHADNDVTGSTQTREITSLQQVGSTDIVIGKLNSTPGPTIAFYSVALNPTTSATFGASVYSDRVAFNVGLNNTGSGTTRFRVGRNELDGFQDLVGGGAIFGDAITFDDDRGTPASLGDDETDLVSGDSGAPLFVTSGSNLIVLGTNWFTGLGDPVDPVPAGASFMPNHLTEINAILALEGESLSLVSVPEPSAMLCSLLGISLIFLRRSR